MPSPGERVGLAGDERAATSPLAYILIISIIVVGTTSVVVFGSAALADTQTQSELRRAQHSMTLFDSRAAMVALGTSDTQTLHLGVDSGQFYTRPETGYLAIYHINYSESNETEVIYNQSLGSFVYENAQTHIAYQGGGVWRLDRGGEARMISPPEFHYRLATLTLPIIQVSGSSAGGGSPSVTVSAQSQARPVYPNSTASYDGLNAHYNNPVENGTVMVSVHSRYYNGWANYFRQRTSGRLSVDENNRTANLTLVSFGGSIGDFRVPSEGASLEISGFGTGHPINDFSITLQKDPGDSSSNHHWSFWSNAGNNEFEVHLSSKGKCQNNGVWSGKDFTVSIYYRNLSTGQQEEWANASVDPDTSNDPDPNSAVSVDCSSGSGEVTLNFTNSDTTLEHGEIEVIIGGLGNQNKWYYGEHIKDGANPGQINQHHPEDDGHSINDSENFDFL
ncbi:MAG: hypothetical protein ABEJ05_11385, partial [Haloglomus sp.]